MSISSACLSQIQILDADLHIPLAGVTVSSHQHGTISVSDANGLCFIPAEWKGNDHVHFEKPGYEAVAIDCVFPLSNDRIQIEMRRTQIEMKHLIIEDSWTQRMNERSPVSSIQPLQSDLRLHSAQNFASTLQYLPGLMAIQTGIGIAKPVIRGMTGARVSLIDNGLKQEGQQWGNDHGWELDQYELENIEIIKGPASLQYGSDAAGGAIIIQPAIWPTSRNELAVRSFFSSNNQREGLSLSYKTKFKIKKSIWAMGLRGTLANSEDYRLPTAQYTYLGRTLPIKDGVLNNTATQEQHGTFWMAGINGRHAWRWVYRRFQLKSGLFPGIIGVPSLSAVQGDGDSGNIGLPGMDVIHDKAMLQYTQQRPNGFWQTECGLQLNQRQELARPHQDGFAPPNADSLSLKLTLRTFQINARRQWKKEHWIWMVGGHWQHQKNERGGVEFLIPSFNQWIGGVFGWAEWEPQSKEGVWSGGLRFDQASFTTNGFAQFTWNNGVQGTSLFTRAPAIHRKFDAFSGSLGWSSNQDKKRMMKWNVARSFRMPQPSELTINGVHHGSFRHEQGNALLSPEQGWQGDMTIGDYKGDVLWHVAPFVHYYNNYIYLSPQALFSYLPDGGQLYQYVQAPVFITGGEIFLEKHWWDPLHTDLAIEGVYTYNQKTQLGLPFIPPVQLKSNAVYEREWKNKGSYQMFAHGRQALAQNRVERNEKTTPGYFVLDAGASWQCQLSEIELEWILSVNNVFNRKYFNNLSNYRWIQLPEQGRWIQVQCCIKIQ